MIEELRRARNEERLAELYPTFADRVEKVLRELEALGWYPRIQDAWRSINDQEEAYNKGHAKVHFGFHNVTGINGNKEALAVDMLDDEAPLNPSKPYLLQLAAEAEKAGLVTGIRWGLPDEMVKAIDTAIANEEWRAPVKIGWDPTHIQPTGITIAEAKAGKRPD